jgi:PPP family 3-phenylpropionic acid transporter
VNRARQGRLPLPRLSNATRLSLFYLLHYAAMGVHLPAIQLWYQTQGVTPAQLGAMGFVTILARVVTGPIFGSWVDRNGQARRVCLILGWLTLAVFALNLVVDGFWALLAVAIVYTVVRAPSGPLGDALTLAVGRREPIDFGRVRFWGSAAFLAVAIGGGPVIDRLGIGAVPSLCLILFAAAILGAALLPRDVDTARGARPQAPVRFLLRQPVFLVFLAASSFAQASHAVLYAFSTLHWNAVGLDQSQIGWLWGVSAGIELVLLWYSRHTVARIPPAAMLLIGSLCAVPRWGLHAMASEFWSFVAIQCLHVGTFGFTYLGAVHFIARHLPASHAASAQTLNAGANALMIGLAMWALGPVYAASGGKVYFWMAGAGLVAAAFGFALLRLQPRDRRDG